MRHLEGAKRREVLASIKRPAPPTPASVDDESVKCVEGIRHASLDSSLHVIRRLDERRSLGDLRLGEVAEAEENDWPREHGKRIQLTKAGTPSVEGCLTVEERRQTVIETVIPSPTVHVDIDVTVTSGVPFPRHDPSPLAELRDKIINIDRMYHCGNADCRRTLFQVQNHFRRPDSFVTRGSGSP